MFSTTLERLEDAFMDTTDVYVSPGVDREKYFSELIADIRGHICAPFKVSAKVMPPGFVDAGVGGTITGLCVAKRDGYWLVYRPESDRFYCFWGQEPDALGAHGVFGSPLYCWTA